jgi:DNA polymerase I-like protein with 3'-5' exonuclease and polymerase domains
LNLREIPRFKEFLENIKNKILHNGKFDYIYLYKQCLGISKSNIYDSLLTEAILNAGVGMKFL